MNDSLRLITPKLLGGGGGPVGRRKEPRAGRRSVQGGNTDEEGATSDETVRVQRIGKYFFIMFMTINILFIDSLQK